MPKVILDWDAEEQKGIIISEYLDIILNNFSIPNPVEKILSRKFGNSSFISKRLYALPKNGRFETGFYFELYKYLTNIDNDFTVETTDELKEHILIGLSNKNIKLPELSITPHDYQADSIQKCLKLGYGITIIGTGGGKTLVMSLLERSIRKIFKTKYSTIIILPAHLVNQTYKEFVSYNIPKEDIFCWQGNDLEVKPIILASFKTLHAKLGNISVLKPRPKKEKETKETKEEYEEYLTDFRNNQKIRIKEWKKNKRILLKQLQCIKIVMIDECIKPGQLVKTSNGNITIENIKIGDLVLSYNIDKKINEYKPVTQTYKNLASSESYNEYIEITLENNTTLTVTPNHRIYTKRGLIRADELIKSDDIITCI